MAVRYNICRNKMTDMMFTEVYMMAIVWLLNIHVHSEVPVHNVHMYRFITADSIGTW